MNEKMQAISKKIEDLKLELAEQAKILFKEEVNNLFAKYPELEYFTWVQYTPHFNDGDPCVFRGPFSFETVKVAGKEALREWEIHEGFTNWRGEIIEGSNEDLLHISNDIESILDLPDDVWLTLFGDHAEVKATRDGFTVEEFSHD